MTALISSFAFLMLQESEGGGGEGGAASAVGGVVGVVVGLAIAVIIILAMWKIFTKAGEPGWASIIPIYNLIVLLKIVGRPAWWFILCLIPFVNFIVLIIVNIDLARKFGKGAGFGFGLFILGIIFYPILAFGDSTYNAAA